MQKDKDAIHNIAIEIEEMKAEGKAHKKDNQKADGLQFWIQTCQNSPASSSMKRGIATPWMKDFFPNPWQQVW